MLAPIILLVYNRPDHTKKTLEALMANELADQSELFIFADGPKEFSEAATLKQIALTRKVIKEKQWCGKVNIIEGDKNLGVDESTIRHVTTILNRYEKVIVLEDDIVTSKGFLNYMNKSLDLYKDQNKIFGISGYMYPNNYNLPEVFIVKGSNNPWGWATWKRAWIYFNPNYLELANHIESSKKLSYSFNYDNTYNYLKMLKDCSEQSKPWDIRWYASVFIQDGFSIWPGKSMVQNIGHDNSGVHCGVTDKYFIPELAVNINPSRIPLKVNNKGRKAIKKFNRSLTTVSIIKILKAKIFSILPVSIKTEIKMLFDKSI